MYKIGIDLGGTKIEGIVLDKDLKEIYRKRISTEQEKGYEHIIHNISSLYHTLTDQINNESHTFGICTPGSISFQTGLLKNSNTICLNNKPFLQDLEIKLNRKIAIDNDANCFAMTEALMGAGIGKQMVFGVIMGTGCGGGIVFNKQLIRGKQSIAGEWGHTTIDPKNGPKCYCGKRGCVETYISGGGLENRFAELSGEKISLERIVALYKSGNSQATQIINNFYDNFGIALSNLINTLDPDVVVLGGGLSNIDELYTKGIDAVKKYIFNDTMETLIVKNKTGDSAGVFGAALIGV